MPIGLDSIKESLHFIINDEVSTVVEKNVCKELAECIEELEVWRHDCAEFKYDPKCKKIMLEGGYLNYE